MQRERGEVKIGNSGREFARECQAKSEEKRRREMLNLDFLC